MSIFADSILLVYSRDTNGRKTIMALTDTKVRSAKPEEKEYSLVDGDGMCSGQQKLATALEFFQYRFSDSFGGNPPLYSCGLSAL